METYQQALERLLGVKPGELNLVDEPTLRLWFEDIPNGMRKPATNRRATATAKAKKERK
jgi:hypothetical protein